MKNLPVKTRAICFALLAAALYAFNLPFSKLLLKDVPSTMMAAFLYLGAGIGMTLLGLFRKTHKSEEAYAPLTRKDLPYTLGMILLDIAAPICLMAGLKLTTAANASLLSNFEIAATSLIAFLIFKEQITKRLFLAIVFVTLSSLLLSFEDISSLSFSYGSLFVLLACVCWGLENNCTKKLSSKDSCEIVMIKGIFSGLGSLIIALSIGERFFDIRLILTAMLLGFVSYGLSIFYYIRAQKIIGAAKTSTYYAIAPFIGTALSFLLLREQPSLIFYIALPLMILGAYLAA